MKSLSLDSAGIALSVSPLTGLPLLLVITLQPTLAENKDILLSGEQLIALFHRAFRALGISLADFAKRLNETSKKVGIRIAPLSDNLLLHFGDTGKSLYLTRERPPLRKISRPGGSARSL